jgi:hypothetical protein
MAGFLRTGSRKLFHAGTLRIFPCLQAKAASAWVDFAKGICIVLVVLMHSTLGVENAARWPFLAA